MSGWRNSQSACHTLRPFSSLVFCMKSDSRMWPQMGAKRYTNVCKEERVRGIIVNSLHRISSVPARLCYDCGPGPGRTRPAHHRKAIRVGIEGRGDGAKNAAIILVGRGSNGAVAFGNNGRGEKERETEGRWELQEGLSSRSSLARPLPRLSLAHSPPAPPFSSFPPWPYRTRPLSAPQSARIGR